MVIGIDTSGLVCSVAVVDGARLISEFSLNHKKTHSEQLLPMLEYVLNKSELSVGDADCFAVSNGPGSFTGLRIGAATAQGLALASGKPVIGVSSLLAMAYNIAYSRHIVVPIMDARRNEVYTAAYRFTEGESFVSEVISPEAIPVTELSARLNANGESVVFVGDGIPVYKEELGSLLKVEHDFAPAHINLQRASSIAVIGQRCFESDRDLKPLSISYLRRPQAERERLGL